ncbi:hypothetical protein EDD11_009398 [Mortierella claussenii]|nr:hypothetical protein EDD11_009398 [Mortierella claussenii]
MRGKERQCRTCETTKSTDEFYKTDKNTCKECKILYARNRYHAMKSGELGTSSTAKYIKKVEEKVLELEEKKECLEIVEQKIVKLEKIGKRELQDELKKEFPDLKNSSIPNIEKGAREST